MKKDLILGGWMGFIIGLILLLAVTPEGLKNNWEGGLSTTMVTVLYGYMLGNLVESFWSKNRRVTSSPTFVGFFVCGMMCKFVYVGKFKCGSLII